MPDTDERERHDPSTLPRRKSLWPVALIPLVGGLLLTLGFVAASRIHPFSDGSKQLLDTLEREVTAVKPPPGTHAVSVKRYRCQDRGDSGFATVSRVLAVESPGARHAAIDGLARAFKERGWSVDRPPEIAEWSGYLLRKGDMFGAVLDTAGEPIVVEISGGDIC